MPVRYTAKFKRRDGELPKEIRSRVNKAIEFLDHDYRHPGLQSHPVQGYTGVYEARVDDKYRMTYERRGDTFIMRNVDNHDECLKNP